MVKDPDITAVYDMYWGTWIGEDDSELIVGLNGSGKTALNGTTRMTT